MFFIKIRNTFVWNMNFSKEIKGWFAHHRRDLPWRNQKDPYQIWLSEIILQQTRVAQGLPYFLKYIEKYPTIKDFANADLDDILRIWQGLGYYSRARNMHFAAQQVINEFGGEFPKSYKELILLKGVGAYTAAAIASISFEEKVAVVDGNVYRVLSRYFNEPIPIDSSEGVKLFQKLANELIEKENPGDHNQALMEIGALVCSPKNPDCENCPLNFSCEGFDKNTYSNLPIKSKKVKVRERYFTFLHFECDGKIWIQKREAKDIWNGLYQLPMIETDQKMNFETIKKHEFIESNEIISIEYKSTFVHKLTHQKIFADFYFVSLKNINENNSYQLIKKIHLDKYALPKLIVNYFAE
jgi:A/G-specific adenine glycosylase